MKTGRNFPAAEVTVSSSEDWSEDFDAGRVSKDHPTLDTDTPQSPLELSIESAGLSQGMSTHPPKIPEDATNEDEIIVSVKDNNVEHEARSEARKLHERREDDNKGTYDHSVIIIFTKKSFAIL